MRRPTDDHDDKVTTPFPTVPVSNGEWMPPPITPRARTLQKLIGEEMTWRAKWHGMTRAQFALARLTMAVPCAGRVVNRLPIGKRSSRARIRAVNVVIMQAPIGW